MFTTKHPNYPMMNCPLYIHIGILYYDLAIILEILLYLRLRIFVSHQRGVFGFLDMPYAHLFLYDNRFGDDSVRISLYYCIEFDDTNKIKKVP